jgi:uncharacterized protein
MPLELKPNCETCDADLPPQSTHARICSFECTYCADCATNLLHDICPNCGGNLQPRPIRPSRAWRPGVSLVAYPASSARVLTQYSRENIASFVASLRDIPPEKR